MKSTALFLLLSFASVTLLHCRRDEPIRAPVYNTAYVVIILIDGPRYSETWGESQHQYIPGLHQISKNGVVCTNFRNDGTTNTVNGHVAITTGFYENLDNGGSEYPTHISLFQQFLESRNSAATDAWIIASKDKLQVLGDCKDTTYKGRFNPSSDCGNNGLFTGYREDSVTFRNALGTLASKHPHLVFISFKQPDSYAHAGDWNNYLSSLQQSDDYALRLWQFLQSDPIYKDKTTVFITNDHGRHLDGVADGFASHGDDCLGCRHIMLLATGPDFTSNPTLNFHYGLTDIHATICKLFGLKNMGTGKVMQEIFK